MARKSTLKIELDLVEQSISSINLRKLLSDTLLQLSFGDDSVLIIGKDDIKKAGDIIISNLVDCLGLSEELDAITRNDVIKVKSLFKI
jgi:hypothetical protein